MDSEQMDQQLEDWVNQGMFVINPTQLQEESENSNAIEAHEG